MWSQPLISPHASATSRLSPALRSRVLAVPSYSSESESAWQCDQEEELLKLGGRVDVSYVKFIRQALVSIENSPDTFSINDEAANWLG